MNAIVAVDQNWGIGFKNELLFSLPSDMKRFRALTLETTVIMGRKTLESFPNGKPLPKRHNIVISHAPDALSKEVSAVGSIAEAVELAILGGSPAWVIGGSTIYREMLPFCDRVFVTKVETEAEHVDAYFPNLDEDTGWRVSHIHPPITENGLTYRYFEYVRT